MKRVLLLLMVCVWLVSCGKKETEVPKKDTLVYAQLTEAKSLDPHASTDQYSQRVIANIYDRLVEVDEDMNIIPSFATEWKNDGDTTMVFKLREGVKFHSGKEATAEDVKFSLERAMGSPKLGSLYTLFDRIEVVDKYTVSVTTKKPFGALLYHLSHKSASILNKEFVEENEGNIDQIADGTGAYMLDSWTAGDNIVLKRNAQYFRGEPAIEYIKIRSIAEENSKVIGLETGEIDIAADLESMSRNTILENNNLILAETSSFSVQYLGMNVEKPYLNDIKVRKAIAMAIDKDIIIETILMGAMKEANSFLAPGVFGYSKSAATYEYNPEEARKLIEETGYENIELTVLTSNNTTRAQICEVIQAQLKEIGVDLKIEIVEWGTFLSATSSGKAELYMLGWSPSTGDGDYGLVPNTHSANKGSGGNRSFYENKELDRVLDMAKEELDVDRRRDLYAEAQDIINEDVPVLPLYYQLSNAGLNKSVKGYVQTSANYPYFYKLSFQ
ncbi:diguanylate phosphodiesterase [Propionigenium maris DSM 9537]|uniref:Diguanylate phosphodiesterase n=1 Tax=Propionigenium maris DSM 9537 TaxID=1123000 RepID=A0A9W6LLK8_9FUSO|nr:ABC transporter substrate-binding protein [Propionigenium maris]GLI54829.1 diguanylate phosphodiesterase [Propionigenium maris DSM 9537]